jgi:hypothetical protein
MKEKNMGNPSNPFSDFDDDFKNADPSDIPTPGRVPPATYKFVLTTQEIKKGVETVVADYEIFVANSGSKGFKIFCEILDPETVPNPKTGEPHVTKGVVVERVFWGTKDNLIYMKRDLQTILGRLLKQEEKLSEILVTTQWAGRTFEGVVRDEEYPLNSGRYSSRIAFINPWTPPTVESTNPHGAATGSKDAAKTETKKVDPKPDPKVATKSATPAKDSKQAAKTGGATDSW